MVFYEIHVLRDICKFRSFVKNPFFFFFIKSTPLAPATFYKSVLFIKWLNLYNDDLTIHMVLSIHECRLIFI